jgi:hypothetical protein
MAHPWGADAPALTAEVARLERELAALAAAFDRLWEDETEPLDLAAGARLHDAIAARLAKLEAVRTALAHRLIGSPEGPAPTR